MDRPLAFACWSLTPALVVLGVWFRKGLSVPQALSAYAVGPALGLASTGLWFVTWKVAFNGRPVLGDSSVDQAIPFVVGGLLAYLAPFIGLVFRRGRAVAMSVVAVLAPVAVFLVVNFVSRKGLAGASAIGPLWLCVFVTIPTAFCLTPGVARSAATPAAP